jgi:hypothetical protein
MTWGVPDETAATENATFLMLQKRLISSGANPAIVMITGHGGRPVLLLAHAEGVFPWGGGPSFPGFATKMGEARRHAATTDDHAGTASPRTAPVATDVRATLASDILPLARRTEAGHHKIVELKWAELWVVDTFFTQ